MGGWEGGTGVLASHMAPPGSAWLVKHSCHFVHLKVGLLTQVEKWKGAGAGASCGQRVLRGVAGYFKEAC